MLLVMRETLRDTDDTTQLVYWLLDKVKFDCSFCFTGESCWSRLREEMVVVVFEHFTYTSLLSPRLRSHAP